MYITTLIACVKKHLRDRFRHAQILNSDNKMYSAKATLLKLYKKRMPTFLILFHSFRNTDDLTAAVFIDSDSHKDRDIVYLTIPAAFEIDAVYIDIRIFAVKLVGTPLFYMIIGFFVEVALSCWVALSFPKELP